jgi:hypothetical protein
MHIQVSLIVDIDASASLSTIEQQIQEAGHQSMRQALQQGVHQWEREHRSGPYCGRKPGSPGGNRCANRSSALWSGAAAASTPALPALFPPLLPSHPVALPDAAGTGEPRLSRSGLPGWFVVALSAGGTDAGTAVWSTDQRRRDSLAHPSLWSRTGSCESGKRRQRRQPNSRRKLWQEKSERSLAWMGGGCQAGRSVGEWRGKWQ